MNITISINTPSITGVKIEQTGNVTNITFNSLPQSREPNPEEKKLVTTAATLIVPIDVVLRAINNGATY